MRSGLLNFLSELRASYWYIPLLMAIAAFLLSILTLWLDNLLVWHWLETLGWLHAKNPEGARIILSTIATSMITVAGVTFSMTIVAVAFAASQVGPRLTTNFMRDKANQITLGTFIATFLFCLFILLALFNANKTGIMETDKIIFVPHISLLVAILLTISSIIVLIYFIHHIPESINMSNIIARVGEELNRQIDWQFPVNIGKENPKKPVDISQYYQKRKAVFAKKSGYIRILDGNFLIDIAQKNDLIIQLEVRPGHFVTKDTPLLYLSFSKDIEDSVCEQCLDAFALGYERNQEQDILFLVNEMVEIIARALSPGVNDPFTAITCLDWLQSNLVKISKSAEPSPYRYDPENSLRLITKPISFTEFCELIFCRIQPYVCRDRNTALHLMTVIISIYNNSNNHEHKITLASHAQSLKDTVSNFLINEDSNRIRNLYNKHFST